MLTATTSKYTNASRTQQEPNRKTTNSKTKQNLQNLHANNTQYDIYALVVFYNKYLDFRFASFLFGIYMFGFCFYGRSAMIVIVIETDPK